MRVSRHYLPQALAGHSSIEIVGESAHYLHRVLRLKKGESVRLFNETDGEYAATIADTSRGRVEMQIEEAISTNTDPVLQIHLGLGLSRGERMDYAIQKSTELGVSFITPLFTEHCEVKLSEDRIGKKLSHWQKIGISASEQCGRTKIPNIHEPQKIANWLADSKPDNSTSYKVILDHRSNRRLLDQVITDKTNPINKVFICIGPEGGFSEGEIALAEQAGFSVAGMGPRVLRTETAPISALSIIQYLLGDF